MKYQLVMWDFDGTLADTLSVSLRVYNVWAARHGYQPIENPAALRDLSTLEVLRQVGLPLHQVPRLIREIVAGQRRRMEEIRLFPGVAPAIRRLARSGCRLGVITSNSEANVRTCLRAHGVEECFEFVTGYARLLGKQSAIRRVLRHYQLPPALAAYVGDEVRDMRAAAEVGVPAIAVCWGVNSPEVLARCDPACLIEDERQLERAVERWLADS